jgi:hypothetical protein
MREEGEEAMRRSFFGGSAAVLESLYFLFIMLLEKLSRIAARLKKESHALWRPFWEASNRGSVGSCNNVRYPQARTPR